MHKFILVLALSVVSPFIFAAEMVFKDWRVVTETDVVLNVPVCRAYTQITSNLPIPVELSVSFPTAFDRVPMMILRLPANSAIQRAVVPFTTHEQEDLLIFQAAVDPTGHDLLWYVPIQMEKMVDIIIGNNTLPLKFTQAGKEVAGRISLTGSSAALNQIARCLKVNEILPTRFFKELNTAAGNAPLGPDQTVAQLMIYVDQAFGHYREIAKGDADLVKLRASMKALVQQETEALRLFNTAQGNLDRATVTAAATREKIRSGEERLQLIPGETQALQQQKAAAEQLLAEKKAVYDPIKQQMIRYENAVDSAQNNVNSISRAISSRENTISQNTSRIRNLEGEANDLDRAIDRIDRELGPLERKKSELESALASYNVELEKQKILNNNSHYGNFKNERDRLNQDIRQNRTDLQQAQNQLRRAEEKLRQCKANTPVPRCDNEKNAVAQAQNALSTAQQKLRQCESTSAPKCDNEKNQVSHIRNRLARLQEKLRECLSNGGGNRGGRPSEGGQNCERLKAEVAQTEAELSQAEEQLRLCENAPGPNCDGERHEVSQAENQLNRAQELLRRCTQTVQVPNCSSEENEVNQTRLEVNRLQAELNSAESRLSSVTREISRIETDAQNQAIRGHDDLASELRRVAGEIAEKRLTKERAQDRIRAINNSEIPRLQQEISRAQSELPGLRNNLATAQRQLANARLDLQNYKNSVEFDRVEREYLAAKRALEAIVSGISDRQLEQAQINRNLPTWRTQLQTQEREVQRLTPIRDTAKTKVDGIQAQLEPARRQEQALVNLLATLTTQYNELRKLYQTLANQLLAAP